MFKSHKSWALLQLFLFIIILFPFIMMLLFSFFTGWSWPHLFPQTLNVSAWSYLFSGNAGVQEAITNSLVIAFSATAVNLLLALPAAHALAQHTFAGKKIVEALLFAPLIIPPFVAMMGLQITLIQWNLTDTRLGVTIAHLVPTFPYLLRPLYTSFTTLASEWNAQARLLGASRLQRFWYVSLPHLMPGILAGVMLSLLVSFSQYLITLLIGGGAIKTLPLILFPYITSGDLRMGATFSILFTAVTLSILFIVEWCLKRFYKHRHTVPM
ncbi:ABC transporter permease subunit [Hazenella sp. IB182357]|uniref:ABC transporter permease subunit n=1 Tax=Polycladospora coralii TaxID=2771432 RepID=A0A926NAB7_9BACL|nr:ABC transporter permease subunit [Polycladospora coralii]MBD1373176.1 ABC transporter permease subunit [Polycladospora coralii]MBS7531733.1 ABC transporter permease subunit [Polycladospora coralii]